MPTRQDGVENRDKVYIANIAVAMKGGPCGTSKKTDNLANLCFPCAFAATDCLRHFVRLKCREFPRVFIDSSMATQNSAPSTKKDATLEITMPLILFDNHVFSCQIFQQGDFVMIDRGRENTADRIIQPPKAGTFA